jgi:hypothetical protein
VCSTFGRAEWHGSWNAEHELLAAAVICSGSVASLQELVMHSCLTCAAHLPSTCAAAVH